jgi:tetratricopeptide (TPR) repeat protein
MLLHLSCLLLVMPLACAAVPPAPPPADAVEELARQAAALHEQGRFAGAERAYRAALDAAMAEGGRHSALPLILNNLASVLQDLGRPVQAATLYARALALYEQRSGKNHPVLRKPLANLASLALEDGQARKAERLYRRALALPPPETEDPDGAALIWHGLGLSLQAQGRLEDAGSCFLRAIALRSALSVAKESLAHSLSSLALVRLARGQAAEALADQRRALELLEAALPPSHPALARPLSNLAAIHVALGRPAEAEPSLRRALGIAASAFGEDHELYGGILSNYAEVLRQLHRKQEARQCAARAREILAHAAAAHAARLTLDLADAIP